MKKATITLIALSMLLVAACGVTKKSRKPAASSAPTAKMPITSTTVSPPPPTPPPTTSTTSTTSNPTPTTSIAPFLFPKPANGVYAPRAEELTAIQTQYKEVTLNRITEGYKLYAQGACINCHNPKNIYDFKETAWKGIIDDMGQKALLSDVQKDDVYKYVLSIKATQPK